jgi:1-phosphatidylinositol-3-phosphate 5-kinase
MSWGSYLEHCFYPPEGKAGFTCPHDAYRDQIRYFAHRNLAIRIHNENIDIYEPVRPSISLQVKVETRVVLKNREYENALQKNTAFFDSVLFRLRSFDYDIVQPEQVRRPTFRNDIADA